MNALQEPALSKACHPLKNSPKIMFPVSNTAYLHCGAKLTTLPLI
jgi:hypothetical protein